MEKYGCGQYNGILKLLMGQINCIDSDESDEKKKEYLVESYSRLFVLRSGLNDFVIYDADAQLRNELNERYNEEVKKCGILLKIIFSNHIINNLDKVADLDAPTH